MSSSVNGWPVLTSPPSGTIPEFITGRVRPEDVDVVFTYLCTRIDREVEAIRVDWSWGWAYRPIRGQSSGFSNHASGTAIDINAPAHPLGVRGTWSAEEIRRIDSILAQLQGTVFWGEHYVNRKDGMHFEIATSGENLRRVANLVRAGHLAGQEPAWKPKHAVPVNFGKVQDQFLIAAGVSKGKITPNSNGVGLIQRVLNRLYPDLKLTVDGTCGPATLNAWGRWEDDVEKELSKEGKKVDLGRPRIPDRTSFEALRKKAGWEKVYNKDWD